MWRKQAGGGGDIVEAQMLGETYQALAQSGGGAQPI